MYKDFKKTESLDTGFVGGSGIVWMFSGIVIGLLVGLGMYYFSNMNAANAISVAETMQSSEQKIIKKEQFSQPPEQDTVTQAATQTVEEQAPMKNISLLDEQQKELREQQEEQKKPNSTFSYYAVLPNLNVPVGQAKAVDTRDLARDSANINQSKIVKKDAKLKGKNKASAKQNSGKYVLQIASFKRKSSANVALRELAKRGIKARIQKKKIKGRLWYRISANPQDKTSANSWKKKAEKLGHKPRIFQLKN